MNPASAAAAASTPSFKGGVHLDSFDARIVEYHCALRKLELLATHTRAVHIKVRSQHDTVPLLHYIVTLSGPWIANAHETLKKRLDQVARLEVPDMKKVSPQVSTNAINFEVDETLESVIPDYTRTDVDYPALFTGLLAIIENSIGIYQQRLKQCVIERDAHRRPDANHKPIPLDPNAFKDLLEPHEILTLSKLVTLRTPATTYQFKISPIILGAITTTIQNITKYRDQLSQYKKRTTEAIFKRLPEWQHTNHRLFACFVKLGELYNILRKFGRDLYLPVFDQLHSPKLLHKNVKLELALQRCDEFLKSSRKNENIMFMLTRSTRQGSMFQLKRDVVLSFLQPLDQAIQLDNSIISTISEFVTNWEIADTLERRSKLSLETKAHNDKARVRSTSPLSPESESRRMSLLFDPSKEKLSQEMVAKQQRDRERKFTEERAERERIERERQTVEDIKSKRRMEERERKLRGELTKDRTSPQVSRSGSLMKSRQRSGSNASNSSISRPSAPIVTRQRSGSNASTTSNSSNSSVLNSMRTNSLTGSVRPSQRSPSSISRSPSLQVRRPVSAYMSSPAFDIRSELKRQERAKAAAASTTTASSAGSPLLSPPHNSSLKRTPSLPTNRSPRNSAQHAAGAAAAALKQERHSSLKSNSEMNRVHVSQQQTSGSTQRRSPSPLKMSNNTTDHYLPDINELSITDDVMRTPPRSTGSKLTTPEITIAPPPSDHQEDMSGNITPSSTIADESDEYFNTPSKTTTTSANAPPPRLKSSLKQPTRTLDPSATSDATPVPELSNTRETTSGESSIDTSDTEDNRTSIQETYIASPSSPSSPPPPKKIIKKVRFTGVPDLPEESKPKRKGWINPPKLPLMKTKQQPTSLSYAAQALVHQERMTFSSIKRGQFDVKTGKVVYPEKNTRMMNVMGNGGGIGGGQGTSKKWSLGGRLKDRFG